MHRHIMLVEWGSGIRLQREAWRYQLYGRQEQVPWSTPDSVVSLSLYGDRGVDDKGCIGGQ